MPSTLQNAPRSACKLRQARLDAGGQSVVRVRDKVLDTRVDGLGQAPVTHDLVAAVLGWRSLDDAPVLLEQDLGLGGIDNADEAIIEQFVATTSPD